MTTILRLVRRLLSRLTAVVVPFAAAERGWSGWRRRAARGTDRRRAERAVLPSLLDLHPEATRAPRRRVGVRTIPLDRIVGTVRHPSQNTADFLPLPRLRGGNWRARWQRINRANDRLETLPPVDLVQVGDAFYVEDGHNRVAVARRADAVEIDADVTQLILPGLEPSERGWMDATSIVGGEELRQAAAGRHSRTVEQRMEADALSRADLLRVEDEGP
jgi:hypothetical protein